MVKEGLWSLVFEKFKSSTRIIAHPNQRISEYLVLIPAGGWLRSVSAQG